jgi:hypothetical protein
LRVPTSEAEEKYEEMMDAIREELNKAFDSSLFSEWTQEEVERAVDLAKHILSEEISRYGHVNHCQVICDDTNNTPEDRENGIVNVTIIPSITFDLIPVPFELGEGG